MKEITGLQAVHHFERRAMEYRRASFTLQLVSQQGRMDGSSRFLVRSTAIALLNGAATDETLLASLKLWMLTTSDLRAAQVDDSVFIDTQGFLNRD